MFKNGRPQEEHARTATISFLPLTFGLSLYSDQGRSESSRSGDDQLANWLVVHCAISCSLKFKIEIVLDYQYSLHMIMILFYIIRKLQQSYGEERI